MMSKLLIKAKEDSENISSSKLEVNLTDEIQSFDEDYEPHQCPIEQKMISGLKYNIRGCVWRSLISLLIPAGVTTAYKFTDMKMNQCFGIVLLMIFATYFARLSWTVFRAQFLWRIFSVEEIIPNWAPMALITGIKQYPERSVQSISEFSAIDGAYASGSLAMTSEYSYAVFCCIVIINIKEQNFFHEADEILIVISAIGLMLVGIWDLNPFSSAHKFMHYTGVLLGFSAFVAFNFQQKWSALSVSLSAISLIFAGIWWWQTIQAEKYEKNNQLDISAKQIKRYSMKCLFFEGVFILFGALTMALWVYFH